MTIGDTDAPAYFIYEIYYQLDTGGTGLYKEDTYTDTLTWSLDEANQKLYLMKSSGNLEFKIKSVTNTTLIMTGQESGVGEIEVEFEKQ